MNVKCPKFICVALFFLGAQQLARAQQATRTLGGDVNNRMTSPWEATQTITSTQKIYRAGTVVTYLSGGTIVLNPGFRVYEDARFTATIGDPNGREGIYAVDEAQESREILIYPNPFIDQAVIEFPEAKSGPSSAVVYDLAGREVKRVTSSDRKQGQSGKMLIDTKDLAPGLYVIEATIGEKTLTKKIIKN